MMEKLFKRNKLIVTILTMCCGISLSCKAQLPEGREPQETPYITSGGYKNIYLVDTIRIEKAVCFTTTGGYRVVTSDSVFSQLKSYDDDVLKRDDMFLRGSLTPRIEFSIFDDFVIYNRPKYEFIRDAPKSISAIRFLEPFVCTMFLVNRKYYNNYFTGFHVSPPITDGEDHMFFRVLAY